MADCVAGYGTLAVMLGPPPDPPGDPLARMRALVAAVPATAVRDALERTVRVPVVYAGADLAAVAEATGLSPTDVVALHAGTAYRVHFLGFIPGFAYMGDVHPRLALPRLPAPRPAVPAGAVGVAGRQTGVYPRQTPGGWRLLGRTPLRVYDPGRAEPALFRPGDRVVFEPVADEGEPAPAPPTEADLLDPAGLPVWQVLRPGLFTTVQDLGRSGHQADGVPPAGAADPPAAVLANRLVGNPDGAAVLEVTALGPELAALREVAVAVVGADLAAAIDGIPLPTGRAALQPRGAVLTFRGVRRGCRAYLAVRGGLAVPPVLGSRSADPLGGLGPRPLRQGDLLAAHPAEGAPAQVVGRRLREGAHTLPVPGQPLEVGFLPGPQAGWFTEDWWAGDWAVAPASDRVGVRLAGPAASRLQAWSATELPSEPNVLGAVQVPPAGRPVVLGAGRATVGGYPKPAVVCTADAWRLAQLLPGAARVCLRPLDLAEALRRLGEARAALGDGQAVVEG